jgi:Gpi18-like mannosyltransferase
MEFIRHIKGFRASSIFVIAVIGVFLAAMLRFSLREFQSGDFLFFTERWYQTLRGHGFDVFRTAFYDYAPPYLYALFVISWAMPGVDPVVATKLPSIAADFVCAWYVYRIVRLKYQTGPVPTLASLVVLFAPTVIINSAVWGQTDMLFTAPLIACVYYVLRQKGRAVWIAFGLAFSIKPQAIFLAPCLFALLLRRDLSWRYVAFGPLVCLLTLLPAWIAGRSIFELMAIYFSQGNLQAAKLTWRAPNLYNWLPQEQTAIFLPAGLLFAAGIALLFVVATWKSQARLTPQLLIGTALASVLIMPYVLPSMHERYFFTADVMAILFAFYVPAYTYLAVLIGLVSLFAYQPFLFKKEIIPMPWLALALLIGIVLLGRWLLGKLYPGETLVIARDDEMLAPSKLGIPEEPSVESLYPAGDPLFIHKPNGEPFHGITKDVVRDFENLAHLLLRNPDDLVYTRPRDVTFITYNTGLEESLIERCYKAYGIQDAIILGRGMTQWNWYSKVGLVLEYLESGRCDTPFVLVTDATDVLMINDPAPLIDRFLSYSADILFCNTFVDWPPNSKCRDFETATYLSNPLHCRLSAGAYFAQTQPLLDYLRRLSAAYEAAAPWTLFQRDFDDQLAWRHLHIQEYPRIKVDHLSKIFRRYDIFRGRRG